MSLKLCGEGHPEEGKPCSQGKEAGGRGEPRDSSEGPPTLHFSPVEEDATAGSPPPEDSVLLSSI